MQAFKILVARSSGKLRRFLWWLTLLCGRNFRHPRVISTKVFCVHSVHRTHCLWCYLSGFSDSKAGQSLCEFGLMCLAHNSLIWCTLINCFFVPFSRLWKPVWLLTLIQIFTAEVIIFCFLKKKCRLCWLWFSSEGKWNGFTMSNTGEKSQELLLPARSDLRREWFDILLSSLKLEMSP